MKVVITVDGKKQNCVGPTLSKQELSLLQDSLSSNEGLEEFAISLSALGHETRAKIFAILSVASRVCVCDLAEILEITPSAVSQHLNKMKAAGIVQFERNAQTIYYSLTDQPINKCLERALRQSEKQQNTRRRVA